MGNPAMVRVKKTEKRRKKFEARLGGPLLAYLPKEEREAAQKHLDEFAKHEEARKAEAKAKKAAAKKASAEKK